MELGFNSDTIVALSTGGLPSGVAVVRVSGPAAENLLQKMIGELPQARKATVRGIYDLHADALIDEGLVIWFPGPHSFTGEDCAEFQVHGSKAVVSKLLDALCAYPAVRLAEAGEFTRRAFQSGKLDLTAVDGLSDLLASETEAQRKLALTQSQGALRDLYEDWRRRLIKVRAHVEAEFDFSDEEDVPTDISSYGLQLLKSVAAEIEAHLADNKLGEIIRDGFQVAILGAPNTGKSSLLNALVERDAAIVTDQPGTTRDIVEVQLDLEGYKVVLSDTAGIRETSDAIEAEGIKRSIERAKESDLILLLKDPSSDAAEVPFPEGVDVLRVISKDDDGKSEAISISVRTGHGLGRLCDEIVRRIEARGSTERRLLVTRKRYRDGLQNALNHLQAALSTDLDLELRAEECRLAGDCIGRITGKIDIEDLLDVIFAEFCVGK